MSISVGFNVLSVTLKSSGVHLETSLGVRQFRDDPDCTLRCEVSILDSGKQCMSDFVILSNFRATIGIVSPTLLIAWFQRSETTEVVKVAQNFSSTVGQVVKTLPFHGGNMGSIPIRCIFARI